MQTVKMSKTELTEGADGKTYRKLKGAEAVNCENPVRGQTGTDENPKFAFYEEVKPKAAE